MFRKLLTYITLLGFLIFASGCATYQKHPNFKERHKTIQSVAAMPPEVEIYRLTFKGDRELMHDVMEEAAKNITESIEETFAKRGYEIEKLDLSEEVLAADPNLRTSLFNVRKLFNKRLEDIRRRAQRKFTYTLGPDVNEFANLADSDVLIFTRCDGFKKSGGEIAKDITKSVLIAAATLGTVMTFYYPSVTQLKIAVVDGDNGDILWYKDNFANPNIDAANKKALKAAVGNLVKVFPKRVCYSAPSRAYEDIFEDEIEEEIAKETSSQELTGEASTIQEGPEEGYMISEERPQGYATEETEQIAEYEEEAEHISLPYASSVAVEVNTNSRYSSYISGIKEEIETYAKRKGDLARGVVWLSMDVLPDGRVQNLKVIDDKTSGSSLLRTQALSIINKAYPFSAFTEEMSKEPISVEVAITAE